MTEQKELDIYITKGDYKMIITGDVEQGFLEYNNGDFSGSSTLPELGENESELRHAYSFPGYSVKFEFDINNRPIKIRTFRWRWEVALAKKGYIEWE